MLKVEQLVGGYANTPVLKQVSFEVADGELVGLIGLNGAGKSTTIHEITGRLRPYSGQILLDGKSLEEDRAGFRRQIGFIPETPSLYEELTLREHLETVIMAYDLPAESTWETVQGLLERFRLSEQLDWFPTQFSKGMKQKVMIIQALMLQPRLLIVDEPFLGLDPVAIHDLVDLLQAEKAKGTAILMSTHVLDSAEKICDRFIVLDKGEVKAFGDLEDLRRQLDKPNADLTSLYLSLTQGVTER
ncbi:ABC transporter ATP-binding protein [Streptococcus sp. DD12]|uniref:ABC transporter ATP-binding protein n=1 Tax=Streptococcus sp. DD12 TaxID=1777880 RepID=UPI000799C87F|nr:ABC transporter ATP-binding protein [Streptococcus sp. DD12]KXT75857.1 ABC transporter, ATP-binding protein EcsA [Streptococcus sp. DD12]